MSQASERLAKVVAEREGTAHVARLQRPFVRPRFEIEIDTTGNQSYKPGHKQCETPLSRVDMVLRPWLSSRDVKALWSLPARSGGAWTSMCRTQPALAWASVASPEGGDYLETLASPVLTSSERQAHVQTVTDLLTKNAVMPHTRGGVRVRFFAQPMSRDMMLHAIRLNRHFHSTLVSTFGTASSGHVVDVQPLSDAFVQALAAEQPVDKAGIAALYRAHQRPQHGFDLDHLADDERAVTLHYLHATLDSETLLRFVDTCYAMLKIAHLAGPFEAHHWVELAGEPKENVDDFVEALEPIDPGLAEAMDKPSVLSAPLPATGVDHAHIDAGPIGGR